MSTYTEIVEKKPYRVLSSYSYDCQEKPLRSDRIAEKPPVYETVSDLDSVSEARSVSLPTAFMNVSEIRDHDEFIQLIINAKSAAEMSNEPAPVDWRGYSTKVSPGFKLSKDSLQHELLSALRHLNHISEIERKVFHVKFSLYFLYT